MTFVHFSFNEIHLKILNIFMSTNDIDPWLLNKYPGTDDTPYGYTVGSTDLVQTSVKRDEGSSSFPSVKRFGTIF